jgi:Uma2 family endonuclease
MGAKEILPLTTAEFLAFERESTQKHQYFQGAVFDMGGASFAHNQIFANTFLSIGIALKGKKCKPFGGDLRLHIPPNTLYTYPDISVYCDDLIFTDNTFDTATNPTVLIEILSPSTRDYDLGGKFTQYRDIETLKTYVVIDSQKAMVQKFVKNNDNSWNLSDFHGLEAVLTVESIAVSLPLNEIYEGVKF